MGSRAGGNFRNNLAGGAIGAPSRLGTAGRVHLYLTFRVILLLVESVQQSMCKTDQYPV